MSISAAAPTTDRAAVNVARHDRFYLGMSYALLLIVALGFTPTLYLRPLFPVEPMPAYLYLHGAVLTLWFVWLAMQTTLVARGRTDQHRRMGVIGVGIGVAVVAAGVMASLGFIPRMVSLGRDMDANLARYAGVVWANLAVLVSFSVFLAIAVFYRTRPDIHRRMMLIGSIGIVGPALGRIGLYSPPFVGGTPSGNEALAGVIGLLSLLAAMFVHDVIELRRVHPATYLGAPGMFGILIFFGFVVPGTEMGLGLVRSLL